MADMERNDGKRLQDLVEFVEKTLNAVGYRVETNVLTYDSDGNLSGELDICFIGTDSNTGFRWLVECRDRPSDGAVPISWIEQLFGRRARLGFNKVTAVSTTGFSPAAKKFASEASIELNEVVSLDPSELDKWLKAQEMQYGENAHQLDHVNIIFDGEPEERVLSALAEKLKVIGTVDGNQIPLIRHALSGQVGSVLGKCFAATQEANILKDLQPNGDPITFNIRVDFMPHGDEFYVDTEVGSARVASMEFFGNVRLIQRSVPLERGVEYRNPAQGGFISQSISSQPQPFNGMMLSTEFHHIPGNGLTHIVLKTTPNITK